MKLRSWAEIDNLLCPIEVELLLVPGLPQIHFLGLPDVGIRELGPKIQSALRSQGFDFPRAQKIIVNLRPAHLRKKSKGLDLAIAAALLMETNQIPRLWPDSFFSMYGELDLRGQVSEPEDFDLLPLNWQEKILTGVSSSEEDNRQEGISRQRISQLRELIAPPPFLAVEISEAKSSRPKEGLALSFDSGESELLKICSWGELSVLWAGPPGTGKTTWARSLPSFLRSSLKNDFLELKKLFPEMKRSDFSWRPVQIPHHSNTVASLLGGGVPLRPGEVSRAHTGVLIMDEFLEFDPLVQEALREPLEEGVLRLSRGSQRAQFPTRFQLIATTNLCPCGQWLPDRDFDCGRSRIRCLSTRQKISGPLLDRFDLVVFKEKSTGPRRPGKNVLNELLKLGLEEEENSLAEFQERCQHLVPPASVLKLLTSERRRRSTQRVALAMAQVQGRREPQKIHWEQALEFTHWPVMKLNRGLGMH